MSREAAEFLARVARSYEAAQRPNHLTWYFDAGITDDVHRELAALGLLVKMFGTAKGYAWCLTDAGLASLKARV